MVKSKPRKISEFRTVFDLLEFFPAEQDYIDYLEKYRWNGKVVSPYDPTAKVWKLSDGYYMCSKTRKRFNVKTGTIFAGTKLTLETWFTALYLFSSRKKNISSHQLARELDITQTTAWKLLDKLRESLEQSNFIKEMLEGEFEADETFVGGSNPNRHWDKKVPKTQGRNWKDKIPVLVIIKKGGEVIVQVVPNTQLRTLLPIIRANVKEGSTIYTDEWYRHSDLYKDFNHQWINHRKKQYAKGKVSVNSAENFNSHLKRNIYGIHHWISRKYSQEYMNEIAFRYNTRKYSKKERFELLLSSIMGKNLTYRELTN